ncbi:MAG: hypothetical protein IKC01_07975 [Clostridia bacterium]|nr:hypothetical protein [Clostridia bacterium]
MTITYLAAFTLVCLVSLMLLKKHASSFSLVAEIAVIAIIVTGFLPEFNTLVEACKSISDTAAVSSDVLKTMLKAFSVLTVGGITADICRDNSENALAGVVEIIVKILAVSCAIPTFTAVLVTALSLVEQ